MQYKMYIPDEVYKELEEIAEKKGLSLLDLMNKAIRWVLIFDIMETEGGSIYVRKEKGGEIQEVTLF